MVSISTKIMPDILGPHPASAEETLTATDSYTLTEVPHRILVSMPDQRTALVNQIRPMLVRHHASPEALKFDTERRIAMENLGLKVQQARINRFPSNTNTRKGNLAEVVLAEYLAATSKLTLPVYRLRYNPNVDQAMKGDDVLAFDLDSDPVRIVIGESKFRGVPSKAAVEEIIDGLKRSHQGGIPASLQFVADRLFESGNIDLGRRVADCAILFALEKLQLDYIGLLMSNERSATYVHKHTERAMHRLVMVTLELENPNLLIDLCFDKLENP